MNWRSRLCNLASQKGWLALRRREFPKGALKIVSSGTMYALSFLFIDKSTHIHCNSSGQPRFPSPTHHYHHSLLPPLLRPTSHDVDHLGFNKIKKLLIGLEVHLKEPNADKEAWEAPAITVAREETAQQTETAVLSMQVNPQALPSSDVPVPFMIPSLSAPLLKARSSSTKGRFCTPLKDLGDSEGDKVNQSGGLEGSKQCSFSSSRTL